MIKDPLVSVVIPTYNRAVMLMEAIKSVFEQTCTEFEVVVVDDGSTDNTLEVLKEVNDPRLVVVAGKHEGASAARNLGVDAARGELIAFLDSDDLFLPTKLQAAVDAFKARPELVMVYSHWRQDNVINGSNIRLEPTAEGDIRHDLLMCSLIVVPTVVVRKDVFLKAGGFNVGMKIAEDYDLWCRISSFGNIGLIREPLSIVRLHKNNTFMEAYSALVCRLKVIEHFFSGYDARGLERKHVYVAKALYDVNYLFLNQRRYFAWVLVLGFAMLLDWKRNGPHCKYILRTKIRSVAAKVFSS